MSHNRSVDRFRKQASAVAFVTAGVVAVLFFKLLTMADFADPLQVMVLLATAMVVATAGFGLVALGAYCRFWIASAAERANFGGS